VSLFEGFGDLLERLGESSPYGVGDFSASAQMIFLFGYVLKVDYQISR
jgi:hypothetical protein